MSKGDRYIKHRLSDQLINQFEIRLVQFIDVNFSTLCPVRGNQLHNEFKMQLIYQLYQFMDLNYE